MLDKISGNKEMLGTSAQGTERRQTKNTTQKAKNNGKRNTTQNLGINSDAHEG